MIGVCNVIHTSKNYFFLFLLGKEKTNKDGQRGMLSIELICHFLGFQLTLMFGCEFFFFFSKDLMLLTILTPF